MNNLIIAFTQQIIRFRWLVIAISFLTIGVVGFGGSKITFNNDYRYFFSDQNPNLAAFLRLQRTYAAPDTVLWLVKPKDPNVKVTDQRVLEAIHGLTADAWQLPGALRADSITNYQHTEADEDELIVGDLVWDPSEVTPEESKRISDILLNEPMLIDRLIARDLSAATVLARVNSDDHSTSETDQVMYSQAIAQKYSEAYPDIEFRATGSVYLSHSFSDVAINDITTLTPAMYLMITLFVWLLIRSATGTLSVMTIVAFATIGAMGASGWLGIPLTPPSSGAPTIILTIAVADSIHIIVSMLVEMRRGATKNDALVESMRINFGPVFLTSITTAIGFLTFNFSDAPPFHDLGNMSAMGTMWAWLFSITLLPAMLAVLPITAKASVVKQSDFMARLSNFVIEKRRALVVINVGIVIVLTAMIPTLEINDRFVEYFDDRVQFRRDTDYMAEHMTTIYQIHYSLGAGESDGISDPDYMNRVESFANWLREQPEVMNVSAVTDIMKRLNKSMHADNPEYYTVPETRDMNAQFLLLYEMSLPYGMDLTDQINVDKSATKLTATLGQISTAELEVLQARADNWLADYGTPDMRVLPAGQAVMFGYIGKTNLIRMVQGTLVALVLISLILMIALKSLRLGLISLIPNLAPSFAAFGLVAIFFQEIGMWGSFVTATALGLIVDATVHILSKYRMAREEKGLSAEDGVRYAFSSTGTALWVSSVVLIIGFMVLAYSPFLVNARMGMVVAMTIFLALFLDFLLLPALLVYVDRNKKRGPQTEATNAATSSTSSSSNSPA